MEDYIKHREEYIKTFFKNITDREINKFLDITYLSKQKRLKEEDFENLSDKFSGKMTARKLFTKNKKRYNSLETLLIMSDYVYYPIPVLKSEFSDFIYYRTNNEESSRFIVYYNLESNIIIVSFRGTKTREDAKLNIKFYRRETSMIDDDTKDDFFRWREEKRESGGLSNFTFPLENDREIEVHKGFQENAKELYSPLKRVILKIIDSFKEKDPQNLDKVNLIFTGHSLGGATAFIMSIYFAILFKKNNIPVQRHVVTYGSPPIGNKNFHLLYYYFDNSYYVRVANNKDYACTIGTEGFYITKKIRHIDMLTKNVCILQDINEKTSSNDKETQLFYIDTNSLVDKQIEKMKKDNDRLKPKLGKIYHSFFVFGKNSKLMFL